MKNYTVRWSLLLAALAGGCVTTSQPAAVTNANPDAKETAEPRPDAPLTANTRFAAGQLAETRNDYPQAVIQYEAALKLDPAAPMTLVRLGMVYTSMREYEKAVGIWHKYLKVTHNSAAGYCDLGLTLQLAQRSSEAESAFKSAISADPKNEPARVNYGLLLAGQGRTDDAFNQLRTVLTAAEAHYNIASVLESQGKTEAAKSQYREALRIDPDMSDAKSRLAALDTDLD